jgi:hypothetical protein
MYGSMNIKSANKFRRDMSTEKEETEEGKI